MMDAAGSVLDQEIENLSDARRRVGIKLKLARQTKGLTLKELARRSRCSESLLSKAENGKALPSLPLIHRLVRVLETNISWLFDETEPEDTPVFRAGERPVVTLDNRPGDGAGVSFERIIPYKGGHLLQSTIHHIDVGGKSGEAITHEGEETGYVLRGRIDLNLDGVVHSLQAGDAFCFRSHVPHSYRNTGDEPASILWTCTPPTF
ncbi:MULTISPECIES: cupin domain-containing protein [Mesorhizobium]|jgi:transcriptional regulator with XRE-family HTH domain|uniref:cupin domain-containing protein n=1 Tax=Mesorhizobium TaxID=68287 RepID=UPI00101121BD|nr:MULTISPECIES: cupin domain-containing protein [Mesorhizobium]QAZ42291.1 transcriptional regulator [Mesorhizobium sp. Pch-S]